MMIPCSILPLAYTQAAGKHLVIRLVVDRVSVKAQNVCHVITSTVGVVVIGLLTYASIRIMIESVLEKEITIGAIPILVSPFRVAMGLGVLLFWVEFLRQTITGIKALK